MDTTVAGDTLPATIEDRPIGPGATIGRYRIERRIGAGGMGVVFLAFDPELERGVALKLLRDCRDDDADRLRREARALATLSHPNVVAVHDVGEHDGQLFIAMEYVDGGSLRDWIAKPRPWRDVVRAVIDAGRGIEAAHAAGLVHRDIKPDNLLVGRDRRVRVTDFGIVASANRTHDDVQLTLPGAMIGTPAYMPPEQLTGKADARSDGFSLCTTAYEVLFGVRPFAGNSIETIVSAIVTGEIVEVRRAVPRWVRAAIVRGLAADPAERWPSVGALCDELERRQHRPRRWLIAGGVAVAGIAGSAIAIAATPADKPTCEVALASGVWTPARAQGLAAVLPAGTVPRLDHWVSRWSTASADVCVTDPTNATIRARREACLGGELARFRLALEMWEAGKLRDPLAVEVQLMALPGPWRCSHAAQATAADPPSPVQAMQIELVRRWSTLASATSLADPQHADIEGTTALARAVAYPPLTAEVLVELAKRQVQVRPGVARQLLNEVLGSAKERGDRLAELDASVAMVAAVGTDPNAAMAHAERARSLLAEFGSAPEVEAELDGYLASVWSTIGRPADAAAAYRRGAAECRQAYGDDSQCEATMSYGLLTSLKASGSVDANDPAIRERAGRLFRRMGIAVEPFALPRTADEAIAGSKEMLAVVKRTRPESLAESEAEINLATSYSLADADADAFAHYTRGIALRDKLDIRDTRLVFALEQAAISLVELGRPREALRLASRAVDVARLVAPGELPYALLAYGRTLLEAGDVTVARTQLEAALALQDTAHTDARTRARTRFLLAETLWPADKQRAIDLAHAARVELEEYLAHTTDEMVRPRWQKRLADVDRWLREHQ